jgi:hypothetical protein
VCSSLFVLLGFDAFSVSPSPDPVGPFGLDRLVPHPGERSLLQGPLDERRQQGRDGESSSPGEHAIGVPPVVRFDGDSRPRFAVAADGDLDDDIAVR